MLKELSIETRAKTGALRHAKLIFPGISKQLGLANPNTDRSFYNTYCKTGSLESKQRFGSPKKTTETNERFIGWKFKKNPSATCKQLQCEFNSFSTETTISAKTMRRILRRRKLIGRAAAKKIFSREIKDRTTEVVCSTKGPKSVRLEAVLFRWWMPLQIERWKNLDVTHRRKTSWQAI